jgi:hypothetical protein
MDDFCLQRGLICQTLCSISLVSTSIPSIESWCISKIFSIVTRYLSMNEHKCLNTKNSPIARTAETSLLYSCCKQISVKKPKNKKEVVVQVYAYYHKDIDATLQSRPCFLRFDCCRQWSNFIDHMPLHIHIHLVWKCSRYSLQNQTLLLQSPSGSLILVYYIRVLSRFLLRSLRIRKKLLFKFMHH